MSLKENLVTHPEEEDTSEDMEIEVDQLSDDTKSSSSDSAAKSKMMKFMGIILIITIYNNQVTKCNSTIIITITIISNLITK